MATEELKEKAGDGKKPQAKEVSDEQAGAKRALLLIGAILLVVGGLTGSYYMGLLDPLVRHLNGQVDRLDFTTASYEANQDTIYEMPEILVNLDSPTNQQSFLKLKISLELKSAADVARVDRLMPRILDSFTIYLSRMRLDEIKGGAGLHRVRAELTARVNEAAGPVVADVLFGEINIR